MEQIKFVTPDLDEAFIKKVKSVRDKAIFSTLYYYGLRAGEIRLLSIDGVDLENN